MMIRCACPTLFIIFSILLGCAGTSEAQVILSDSIRDILSTAQIDELKANESVKLLKRPREMRNGIQRPLEFFARYSIRYQGRPPS
ncbi:hypothetical protein VT98_11233 [Candidatus Electrothrix communis]|uniref:Uncharacterized protein n=1 Tax=Candidatus Electrothrix communis TaxID=1859133 RepID=A0A444J6K1_9BACT|nr:hypothetical protein VT98_11233 [Candidatus Electrothrix communis]